MTGKVTNMDGRSGHVANQFIIQTSDGTYFQSYSSVIAFRDWDGNITLDEAKWNYSVTTGKYRNQFLGESKAETEKKIKAGFYKLADLNK